MNERTLAVSKLRIFTIVAAVVLLGSTAWAKVSDYRLAEGNLKVVEIDSDPTESFLALQLDSTGRLFAGSREALFVYEPAPKGVYQQRKLLYRFPKNSWVYGIVIRGRDLYVSTHTAVYLLPDAVFKRSGIEPRRLLWGLPMLKSFEEHQGLHSMVVGPDGDLYMALGDNLVPYGDFKRADHWGHWTFFHGNSKTPFTTTGAVIRLSPDGEQLTPIARGLRNCCGIAFDADWNLFGNDNDHESIPSEYVPGRLVNIVPHAYFSWPRGWLIEKHPWRADLLATLNPNLGRYVPTGLAYYDEDYLPTLRRNLLVAEWGKGVLPRYPLEHVGATFKAEQINFLSASNNVRPVWVAVGRGGRVFVSTLTMAGNEASPVARSEIVMITRSDDAPDAPFEGYEETTASNDKLFSELQNPSWQRRYRAHIELSRRGKSVAADVEKQFERTPQDSVAFNHLLWLEAADSTREIIPLAKSKSDPSRLQAVRAIARFGQSNEDRTVLDEALNDKNPRVIAAALAGILDRSGSFPSGRVFALAQSEDSFLRLPAVQILADRAPLRELQKLSESPSSSERLAGVLALGFRLTVPPATKPLPEDFPLNTKGFSTRVQYVGGVEDLAKVERTGVFTMADVWAKSTKTAEQETIFALLERRLDDANDRVAKQSAFFLRLLRDPRVDAKAASVLGIAPERLQNKAIANAQTTGMTELPKAFDLPDWGKRAAMGDAKKGRELFETRGCAVCHAIKPGEAGGGGPSLVGAGSRFNVTYLVESVITPNKTVAPMFRWTMVRLKNNETFAGLITGETADQIEFLMPTGIRRTVKKSDVVQREIQNRSPMPENLIQTPDELRDLLAFLLTLKDSSAPAPK